MPEPPCPPATQNPVLREERVALYTDRIALGLEAVTGLQPRAPARGHSIGWLLGQLDLVEAEELGHGDLFFPARPDTCPDS